MYYGPPIEQPMGQHVEIDGWCDGCDYAFDGMEVRAFVRDGMAEVECPECYRIQMTEAYRSWT